MSTIVYTDGSCRGNPGPGGWAWVVPDGPYESGHEEHTTNQRMEIMAATRAIQAFPEEQELVVVSDSTYVVKCFQDRWWQGWINRGWKNSQKQPVANRDLWEVLIPLVVESNRSVTFRWVKGHSGDHWNDMADELATLAADLQRGARSS